MEALGISKEEGKGLSLRELTGPDNRCPSCQSSKGRRCPSIKQPRVRTEDGPRRHTIRLENSLSIYRRIPVPHCSGYDHMAWKAQAVELGGRF